MLRVLGDTGVDVHLLLGEDGVAPGAVLAAGLGVLDGSYRPVSGDALPLGRPGPGLRVEYARSTTREPRLWVPGGCAPRAPYRIRRVSLEVDRPFGFLAVHRTSRLVLSAGWVADPVEHPRDAAY